MVTVVLAKTPRDVANQASLRLELIQARERKRNNSYQVSAQSSPANHELLCNSKALSSGSDVLKNGSRQAISII